MNVAARLIAALAVAGALAAAPALAYQETPWLADDVAAGRFPPVEKRLPESPLVVAPKRDDWKPGTPGGEMRMLIGRAQDVRMMSVFGYSRLVAFDTDLRLRPDILASVDNEGDRVFTLHLRAGHRWSDGRPFTSDDFRYYWQDVANNKELSPGGPPKVLLVDGKPPEVSYPDPLTVRYAWHAPNPGFLPALAGPVPLVIFRPGHYLRNFHARYSEHEVLARTARAHNARNWAQFHNRLDNLTRNDNPDLPTLDPWIVRTRAPSERFVFERNPYFHRVDAQGRQLPYIDRVILNVADGKILAAKTGSGESDLQARGLSFANYTFLRQAGKRNSFDTVLWDTAKGAQIALYPNLNVSDPVWRALMRDVRFRRALSLAIDRREINQVVYFGLAVEGANTVLPGSPLYTPELRSAWHGFDLAGANRLLDEIGLTKRDARGVRLMPDGRPLEIVVETAGEDTEQVDVLELIHDSWMRAGVKLYSRPQQREIFRNRIFAGETKMSVWFGLENGLATPDFSPEELAPVNQQGLQWPKWGQYFETNGASGEAVDMAPARELMGLNEAWRTAAGEARRAEIWKRMLAIHADEVFTIGVVANVRQPVVISGRLRNVPHKGIWNWDPGSFFGIYHMDTFWFDEKPLPRTAAVPAR
ncbi:MAG: ABC transporter substrate-binding protein [Rhodospirillales bacterium]|nr:ABC transporter substrate-binding protein [Rhodospirillales bacterium]